MGFNHYKSLHNGIYAENKEFERLKSSIVYRLKKNPTDICSLCKKWEKACKELKYHTKNLSNKDFSGYSEKKLVSELEKTIKLLRKSASYIFLHHVLSDYFEIWLNNLLENNMKDKSIKNMYFHILSSPAKKTKLAEAKNELKRIAKVVKKRGYHKAQNLIRNYTSKYKWLGYDTAIGNDLTFKISKK